eukprot:gene12392-15585_t
MPNPLVPIREELSSRERTTPKSRLISLRTLGAVAMLNSPKHKAPAAGSTRSGAWLESNRVAPEQEGDYSTEHCTSSHRAEFTQWTSIGVLLGEFSDLATVLLA